MTGGKGTERGETNDHDDHDIIVPGEQLTSPGDTQPSLLRPGPGQGSESDHDRSSDTDLSSRESGDQDQVTQAHGDMTSNCVFWPGAVKRSQW